MSPDKRFDEEERSDRKSERRRERNRDKKERDEYLDDSDDDFLREKPVRMLEAPSTTGGAPSEADFIRENKDRRRERDDRAEMQYNMSGGLGRRDDDQSVRY